MLREGQVAVDEFREQAESLVGQAKEAYNTLSSLWEWATLLWAKLVGAQPVERAVSPDAQQHTEQKPVKPKAKRAADPDPEILQMQVVHKVSTQLGEFFDIQQKITGHYQDLELASISVYSPEQNNARKAIERVEVELQMEYLGEQIREAMVYAPRELKDLYSRFLRMYGKIEQEQEFARQQLIMQARYKRAQEWRHQNLKIDLAMWGLGLAIVWAVTVWMMIQIALLSGQSLEWFSLESFVSFVSQLRR
jgi:hypothetical protein